MGYPTNAQRRRARETAFLRQENADFAGIDRRDNRQAIPTNAVFRMVGQYTDGHVARRPGKHGRGALGSIRGDDGATVRSLDPRSFRRDHGTFEKNPHPAHVAGSNAAKIAAYVTRDGRTA